MDHENNMPAGSDSNQQAHSQAAAHAPAQKLDFAQLLSDAWQLGQTKFWNLLGIYLITTVVMVVVIFLVGITAGAIGFIISLANVPALVVLFAALAILAIIVLVFWISTWGLIASFRYLDHSGNPTVAEMFSAAKPFAWGLVPTVIISFLAIMGGFVALIIPGIIMLISLSFVFMVAVLEDKKMWPALVRSRDLVRGRWWNIFIITIAFGIFAIIVLAATGMSYSPLMVVLYPFTYILCYVMYKKLASLPAAAMPTTRGDWYYKAAAGLGLLVIALGIIGTTYAASTDWDEFKKGFNQGFKEGRGQNRGMYYDDKHEGKLWDKNDLEEMPMDAPMNDIEMLDIQ